MSQHSVTLDRVVPLARSSAVSQGVWIFAFALLTCAGAAIKIPTVPVPMTLQTPLVLLAGVMLGARAGAFSQVTYLLLGLVGLPVFAYGGGPAYLVGPTGGYLIGFPIAAFLCGSLFHHPGLQARLRPFALALVSLVSGLAVIFACGVAWLSIYTGFERAFVTGFAALQLWDAVKITGAAVLATAMIRSRAA